MHLVLTLNSDVLAVTFLHLVGRLLGVRCVTQYLLLFLWTKKCTLMKIHLLLIIVKVLLDVNVCSVDHVIIEAALLLLMRIGSCTESRFLISDHLILLMVRLGTFMRIIIVHTFEFMMINLIIEC